MRRLAFLLVLEACGHAPRQAPAALPSAACIEVPRSVAPARIEPRPIAHVTITGAGAELPEVVSAVHARAGDTLDRSLLQADVRRLWALGIASQIDVVVTDTEDGPDVELALIAPPQIERVIGGGALAELALLRALEGALYDAERLARIASLAEQSFQAAGYARARVRTQVAVACGRATVTLDVDIGRRYRIDRLAVYGSALPVRPTTFEHDLGRVNVVGGVFDATAFDEELARWLQRHAALGWVEVKAGAPQVTYDDARGRVAVRVAITPGPRYRFGALPVDGGDARARVIAEAALAPLRHAIYDADAYLAAVDRVRDELGAAGSVASTIAQTDPARRAVEITLVLHGARR